MSVLLWAGDWAQCLWRPLRDCVALAWVRKLGFYPSPPISHWWRGFNAKEAAQAERCRKPQLIGADGSSLLGWTPGM